MIGFGDVGLFWCLLVRFWVIFVFCFCVAILVCRVLCLVTCVLFRVCVMIIVVSSIICLFVGHFSVSVHWEFPVLVCLGCRIVLVVRDVILFKDPYGPLQKSF